MRLHRDYETRSVVDLKKVGAWVYMRHPTTDVRCMSYALDDDPVKLWTPGMPVPDEIMDAYFENAEVWAHNDAFEQMVEKHIMAPRYGFPEFGMSQQRCTMVGAYAMSLPGSLENAGGAVGLEVRKDMAGHRGMMQMARPRKIDYAPGWSDIPFTAVRSQEMDEDGWEVYTVDGERCASVQWWNTDEKKKRLYDYCLQDTEVERTLEKSLRPLRQSELELWHLDQVINQRGILVDTELCLKAKAMVEEEKKIINKQAKELTGGKVSALSNRNQVINWLSDNGLPIDSIAADAITEILDRGVRNSLLDDDDNMFLTDDELDDRTDRITKLFKLRREYGRASVSKIDALLRGSDPFDGRIRELLQFHAASTGRWGGRRFQPQNLKRPDKANKKAMDGIIDCIVAGDRQMLDLVYGDVLSVVADTLRGMLVAAPDHRIMAADYSNIEGRVLAWLAGEEWKLRAFRDYDAGLGHDLYLIAAGGIINKDPGDVTEEERQNVGKVSELMFGYQGGVGAARSMGGPAVDAMSDDEINTIKDAWRRNNPNIKQFWYDMENAAVTAVENPGETTVVGRVTFRMAGSFLAMQLPSKRFIFYPYPEMRWVKTPWLDEDGHRISRKALTYMSTIDPSKRGKIVPDPRNTTTWARISTYGGMLAENATQATARDILAYAMPRLEKAGYPIVLHVHDEAVCEVPNGHGSVREMESIMAQLPSWAIGLPVAVEGFEAERYRK